jgi:hypothetical protein
MLVTLHGKYFDKNSPQRSHIKRWNVKAKYNFGVGT